jgi:hypothetical protein
MTTPKLETNSRLSTAAAWPFIFILMFYFYYYELFILFMRLE